MFTGNRLLCRVYTKSAAYVACRLVCVHTAARYGKGGARNTLNKFKTILLPVGKISFCFYGFDHENVVTTREHTQN